jgi:hypothetical protein
MPCAAVIHQDLAHHARCQAQEMRPVHELGSAAFGVEQAKERVVNKNRGLKRMSGIFPLKSDFGQTVEFAVQRAGERIASGRVALASLLKQRGN